MNRTLPLAAAVLVLAACSQESAAPAPDDAGVPATDAVTPGDMTSPAPGATPTGGTGFPAGEWDMTSSGEGDGLFFGASEGEPPVMHLFCPNGGGLLVNVNAFRPVGSEERMSFGSGGRVVTLVADPSGDAMRGGVSGEGPVPANLGAILTGADGVAVNYGAQDAGPLPPVPAATARNFVAGCSD